MSVCVREERDGERRGERGKRSGVGFGSEPKWDTLRVPL